MASSTSHLNTPLLIQDTTITVQFSVLDDESAIDRGTKAQTIHVPSMLAKASSNLLSRAISKIQPTFTQNDPQIQTITAVFYTNPSMEKQHQDWLRTVDLVALFAFFFRWAYSGIVCTVDKEACNKFYESDRHWRFAQMMGSPRLMNQILKWVQGYLVSDTKPYDLYSGHLVRYWKRSNFTGDDLKSTIVKIGWENKKMLKFLLDVFAHKALYELGFADTPDFKSLLKDGWVPCQLVIQLQRAIGARGIIQKAPWHDDCIGEYLVNEDMTERRFESDCRWECAPKPITWQPAVESPKTLKRKHSESN